MTTLLWGGNVQFVGGSKAACDLYVGAERTLAIDTESMEIRVHDGATPGGAVVAMNSVGIMAWDGSVISELGTVSEGSSVDFSCLAYSAVGGALVTYSVVSGNIPLGVYPSNGRITGTVPNIVGSTDYTFTIEATDGVNTIRKAFTLHVTATNQAPVWNTGASLGSITTTNFSLQLSASDPENKPLTYALVSGSLPPGASLSSDGSLIGTNPLNGNTYNFTVSVSDGVNTVNRAFSMTLGTAASEAVYTTPGTYSFVVPAGVGSICAVLVGGGGASEYAQTNVSTPPSGGGGGALTYGNNITVTPGETLTIVVGAGGTATDKSNSTNAAAATGKASELKRGTTVLLGAGGGGYGYNGSHPGGLGGTPYGSLSYTGYAGGAGGAVTTSGVGGGGGGAAGYNGVGGKGADGGNITAAGAAGAGGGGGGGGTLSNAKNAGGAGGGVGLYGQGANGAGGTATATGNGGGGGSGGGNGDGAQGTVIGKGGLYGGGGGGGPDASGTYLGPATGANGAVRVIWGAGRSFPSNAA